MHVARESRMGGHDYGIARGILALFDWRKRRKERRGLGVVHQEDNARGS